MLQALAEFVGVALIVTTVALLFWPAAFAVAGGFVLFAAAKAAR